MKLISWNVNGLRACDKNGFSVWLKKQKPDIVCLQEIKAFPEQLEPHLQKPKGYYSYFNPAAKPGYSGTAVFTKVKPISIVFGLGNKEIDSEGRVIILQYKDFTLINSYFPNSQREHTRLNFKLNFCKLFLKTVQKLKENGENVILCADWNIAHTEIDLKNPKTNKNNAGFLPDERQWMTELLSAGFIDAFRLFESDGGHYTWWSYRPGVREKNIGWRLDYFVTNEEFKNQIKKCYHQNDVYGSDHCPVVLEIKK
jgi:exodeoxyribonuclease-3